MPRYQFLSEFFFEFFIAYQVDINVSFLEIYTAAKIQHSYILYFFKKERNRIVDIRF